MTKFLCSPFLLIMPFFISASNFEIECNKKVSIHSMDIDYMTRITWDGHTRRNINGYLHTSKSEYEYQPLSFKELDKYAHVIEKIAFFDDIHPAKNYRRHKTIEIIKNLKNGVELKTFTSTISEDGYLIYANQAHFTSCYYSKK